MNNQSLTKNPNTTPPKPQSNNQAIDELIALRSEISGFRKDFKAFSRELSVKVAFGVIGSLIIMSIFCAFIALLNHA